MRIKLRNRLHTQDNIGNATVRFVSLLNGAQLFSGTSDVHGVVTFPNASVPSGTYTCYVDTPGMSADPVGPALANSGQPVSRIYRPVILIVAIDMTGFTSAQSLNPLYATTSVHAQLLTVDIQPVWMASAAHSHRGSTISMVVVHHTGCNTNIAVNTFLAEKGPHYMIDTDGQIVKWVQESQSAWHAGEARWQGHANINARSIGIEIVHTSGDYPSAQYVSLLELLQRIRSSNPSITSSNIVGHSDVGANASGRLGRKSSDPGENFEWSRLEGRDLGLRRISGPPSPNNYGGFFIAFPNGALRLNDNDTHHRFGGATHATVTGTPIRELQLDLTAIGYSAGTANGEFGDVLHHAVIAFQEHFFAGGRGHKPPDGRVDSTTAEMIKGVAIAAAFSAAPPVAAGP